MNTKGLVLLGGRYVAIDCPVPDAGVLRRERRVPRLRDPDPGGMLLRREWTTHGRRLPALLRFGRRRRYQYRLSSPGAEAHRECVRQLPRTFRRGALLAVGLLLLAGAAASGAETRGTKLKITAYINQTWGCQQATEAVLRELDTTYGDRVSVEMVDFGGKGRERWLGDGMKCMGVRIGDKTSAEIVYKGVVLPVRFEMPVGYQWTHDELVLAVRQRLEGVSARDRRPPAVEVRGQDGKASLVVDGAGVLELADRARVEAAAAALLRASSSEGGLAREGFTLSRSDQGVTVMAKGNAVVEATAGDAAGDPSRCRKLAEKWLAAIAAPYPILTRPFPGKQHPRGR